MIEKISAIVSVIISIGLVIFHILLALGKPYGRAAYGGKYEILPTNLKIISIIATNKLRIPSIKNGVHMPHKSAVTPLKKRRNVAPPS